MQPWELRRNCSNHLFCTLQPGIPIPRQSPTDPTAIPTCLLQGDSQLTVDGCVLPGGQEPRTLRSVPNSLPNLLPVQRCRKGDGYWQRKRNKLECERWMTRDQRKRRNETTLWNQTTSSQGRAATQLGLQRNIAQSRPMSVIKWKPL